MDVKIPGLGDIDEVEVIEICVAVGDKLAENDTIVVIESDKASMDIPSPAAGILKSLQVEVGERITEGHVIATLEADESGDDKDESGDDTDESSDNKDESSDDKDESSDDKDESSDNKTESEAAADKQDEPDTQKASESSQTASSGESESEVDKSEQEIEVLVPDIGDASDVVVIEIAVQEGDVIEENDLLVVLESDKASMEIAAEYAGTVLEVAVKVDEEVSEGSLLARLRTDKTKQKNDGQASEKAAEKETAEESKSEASSDAKPESKPESKGETQSSDDSKDQDSASAKVYAGPATRRLARELGVDLSEVKGTGSRNRITKDDVKDFVKQQMQSGRSGGATGGGLPQVAQIDFAKFGSVEMVPLTRIQRRGADNLHRSWVNLPHVTQHDETDITDLEEFRQSLKQEAERKGVKITPLAFIIKACCHALREYPNFNASLHADREQLVRKQYINIGMAVDTPEGLVVPVIKAADEKSIWQLSTEIAELSDKARDKKLAMDDLQGGSFSVSSLGALGGTGFTPIVNAPEVAILGVSKLQTKPLWNGEAFVPRKVLPLSLSYDHRVINGADGGRFMNYLTSALADIRRLAL